MPDLDVITADGPVRVFELLRDARPLLLNLGQPGDCDLGPWADRVKRIDAGYEGDWELPVIGLVSAPTAVLVRPDGYVAWVKDETDAGLHRGADRVVRRPGTPRQSLARLDAPREAEFGDSRGGR